MARHRKRKDKGKQPTNVTLGAMQEYKVMLLLMERGFDVFRAVSPSASCDLIAMKDGSMKRIEVRTARYIGKNGDKINYPKKNIRADIVALVLPNKIEFVEVLL